MWVKTATKPRAWVNLDRMDNLHLFEPMRTVHQPKVYVLRTFNGEGGTTLCECASASDVEYVGTQLMLRMARGERFVDVGEIMQERF